MLDVAPVPDPDTEALLIDIDGFEGPLDVLLALARSQKVDLRQVSILELAEQYLAFIHAARQLRLELAADYLVAAAWLAYLKSRLLLPVEPNGDEPDADEMAARLAFQLRRLEAMRNVAAKLMGRDRLGRDIFTRGAPERVAVTTQVRYRASMLDLLRAYGAARLAPVNEPLALKALPVYAMDQALDRLRKMIGAIPDWATLESFLPAEWRGPERRASAIASTFAASLELAREGALDIEQDAAFGPIRLRAPGP